MALILYLAKVLSGSGSGVGMIKAIETLTRFVSGLWLRCRTQHIGQFPITDGSDWVSQSSHVRASMAPCEVCCPIMRAVFPINNV